MNHFDVFRKGNSIEFSHKGRVIMGSTSQYTDSGMSAVGLERLKVNTLKITHDDAIDWLHYGK